MKKFLLSFLIFSISQIAFAQFQKTFNLADDYSNFIIPANGGLTICGSTSKEGAGSYDALLMHFLTDGTLAWQKQYGTPGTEYGRCAILVNNGYAITGNTSDSAGSPFHIALIKTDTNGTLEWARSYRSDSAENGYYISNTIDNGYIITGKTTSNSNGGTDLFMIRTDANGVPEWMHNYGGPGDEGGYYVIETPDLGFLAVGYSTTAGGSVTNAYLVKTDSLGNLQGQLLVGGTGYTDARSAIFNSNIIISGTTNSSGQDKMYIASISIANNSISLNWAHAYGGSGQDDANFLSYTDSTYLVSGSTTSFGNSNSLNGIVFQTDSNGNVQWATVIGDSGNTYIQDAFAATGVNYITGYTDSFGLSTTGDNDVLLASADSNGHLCNSFQSVSLTVSSWTPTIVGPVLDDFTSESARFLFDTVYMVENSYTPSFDNICVNYDILSADAGSNDTICLGNTIVIGGISTAVGGLPPYRYLWSPSSGLNNDTLANPFAAPSASTTYTVLVTDANGIFAGASVIVTVDSCEGIDNVQSTPVLLYPDPTNGNFIVDLGNLNDANTEIHIYDLSGACVFSQEVSGTKIAMSLNLASGSYILQVINSDHVGYHKLVIQK